uniref:Uncharacterized protein n=1 Tax=Lygus hesperus TaxID=30085 RepID=A0A0K8SQ15_LYGHE
MGLLSVLSVACFVFGSAVIPSEAVPAKQFDFSNRYPIGVQPLIRTNSHRVPSPFGFRKAGARGLISNDVSWLAMLPVTILEWFINLPILVLRTISEFANSALGHFLSAEEVMNRFLKGDIFGPIGKAVEEVIRDVYNLVQSFINWLRGKAGHSEVVAHLSSALRHMMNTSQLVKELL